MLQLLAYVRILLDKSDPVYVVFIYLLCFIFVQGYQRCQQWTIGCAEPEGDPTSNG